MASRSLYTASLEKDTLQRSTDHTEGRVFFSVPGMALNLVGESPTTGIHRQV